MHLISKRGRGGPRPNSGGRRKGAGRKRIPSTAEILLSPFEDSSIPWERIRLAAENKVSEKDILLVFGLSEQGLIESGQIDRFKKEIEIGYARQRLRLLANINDRSQGRSHTGSVFAQSLLARNTMGWDRPTLGDELEPDLSMAREHLNQELVKMAQARSQIEGKKVTEADICYHEARGYWPWEKGDEETE
jgi:hypothetical protein